MAPLKLAANQVNIGTYEKPNIITTGGGAAPSAAPASSPIAYKTPTGGFNQGSVVDYLKSQGQGASMQDRTKLAASNGITGYTGTSAQNQALLAKLQGYGGTTDKKSISGSASVAQGMQGNKAINAAAGAVVPPPPADQPKSQPPAASSPTLTQAEQDHKTQLSALNDTYASQTQQLQTEKSRAIAAAEDSWRRATGGAEVAGKDEYIANIAGMYDTKLKDLGTQHNLDAINLNQTYAATITQQKQDAFNNLEKMIATSPIDPNTATLAQLKPYLQQAMAAGMSMEDAVSYMSVASKNLLANQAAQERIAIAQTNAATAQARAATAEANAANRTDRLDRTAAVNNVNTMVDNFTKSGTPGQQLNNASSYMSSIEAANKNGGVGVSALTLIDALVKLDTGGQAIRQGQTDVLLNSGTYGDKVNTKLAKIFGTSGLFGNATVGANTTVSPEQVSQIYSLAKDIANEKINAGITQYHDIKKGVQETKNAYPGTENAVDATANLGNIDDFINQYSDRYHYDTGSGNLYEKVGSQWVIKR